MKRQAFFKVTIVVTFIMVLILCNGCSSSECPEGGYVEYKPVFGNYTGGPFSDLYIIDESRVDAGHYDRVQLIFEFYNVNYRVVDGKVMVDCSVWANKDYMMNMTTKADEAAGFCKIIRRDFEKLKNNEFKRDMHGDSPKLLEMCSSLGL